MTDNADRNGADGSSKFKIIKVSWPEPGNAVYANNVVVQRDDDIIHLAFFQINPPLVLAESDQERESLWENVNSVNASPVVRVVIPQSKVRRLIEVLSEQLEKSEIKKAEK
jgi:hypothetical protein